MPCRAYRDYAASSSLRVIPSLGETGEAAALLGKRAVSYNMSQIENIGTHAEQEGSAMSISEGLSDVAGSTTSNGWLNVSGSVYGFVDPYFDSDWYVTYLVAGVQYSIQMQGLAFDSYLVLRNASGTALTFANRSGINQSENIVFTPTVSGAYYIDAQSYWASPSNRGFYTVSLSSNARDDFAGNTSTPSTLVLGQPRSAVLENPADADWHRVELVAGKTYSIQATGALSKGLIKIFDKDAIETGVAGTSQITFKPERSGVYFVEISGDRLADVGGYSVLARELPTVSLESASFWEGDAARTTVNFVVRLSAVSNVDVSVRVDSADRTAFAGFDYVALARTIVIPAGQTSTSFGVQLIGNDDWQPHRVFELALSNAVNAQAAGLAWGYVNDDDAPAELKLPTDSQFGFQWNLFTVRAGWAWQLATGKGVKVGVFDQGIDTTNPDLAATTRLDLGRNAGNLSNGGTPQRSDDLHGTFVAGVIAAARDGKGVVGMAYDAQVVPIYSSLTLGPNYLKEVSNAFTYAKSLDVLNNSWGFGNKLATGTNWAFMDDASLPDFAPAFAALKDLAASGRKGLGTIVVQSAGNGYSFGDDTNLHNFQNSRYVITVGATDFFGRASTFSTTGASVLVSAPGGGGAGSFDSILTTDRTGAAGASTSDLAWVDGTSFSAPLVSGIVALMLEVNPGLGYRDVQQILAFTARKTDIDLGSWATNGAANWNGGGMHFNSLTHATGFGQVDALAAVRLAASWDQPALTVANTKEITSTKIVNTAIPDNSPTRGVFSSIAVTEAMVVERVDVRINIKHTFVGDLSILLSSPSGTTSFLLWRPAQGALSSYGSSQDDIHFTFDTVLNWGEDSVGSWGLGVYDNVAGDVGLLENWSLTLVGRPQSRDDVYVYTNEYPDMVAADPSRAILRDADGGNNTLNAAALGLDNRIDLSGHTPTLLNGTALTIAAGTKVSAAIGGDGDDVLIAGDFASKLRGMGGADTLNGGARNDSLEGGKGADLLFGNQGIDTAVFGVSRSSATITNIAGASPYRVVRSSLEDRDQLYSIERIEFTDISIAFDLSGNAGSVAKLIGALFGPGRLGDEAFVGRWLARMDAGTSYADTVAAALASSDFVALAGSRSNAAFVNLVYKNVVGVAPDQASRDHFVGWLDRGEYTQASLAMLACDIDINAAHIGLTGLIDKGLEYLPLEG